MNLLVGTYSKPLATMDAHGDGIYAVSFDPGENEFGNPKLIAACVNPSALVFDPDNQMLFAGKEVLATDDPALTSFSLKEGLAAPVSELQLAGELPCHLAFDSHTAQIASAQYWTGDVALSRVTEGIFKGEPISLQNSGSGPNSVRQQGPHAHCVAFSDNGSVLHVVDLGADLIVSHRLSTRGGAEETSSLTAPAGSGPRHIVINGEGSRAFVICELSEQLLSLRRSGLGWVMEEQQKAFDLQEGVDGACAAIRLSPDGRFLYVSGRRQSRIALFNVEGKPRLIQEYDTGGICPREFVLSRCGEWVFCGNQNSGTVTALRRNVFDGRLSSVVAQCRIGSPVAILEIST